MTQEFGLIADIGGTNIRMQLVELATGLSRDMHSYRVNDYPGIEEVIKHYLDDCHQVHVVTACIAIACPVQDDWVAMTNHDWAFSKRALREHMGWRSLYVINDFCAIAMALPQLGPQQKVQIGSGQVVPHAPIAVLGPGTGLGIAHLIPTGDQWIALAGEGGHADFAPNNETEITILRHLFSQYDHVSIERLLSGPGLVQIYQAHAAIAGTDARLQLPAEIVDAALSDQDTNARQALDSFCAMLGSVAGNLALTLATTGGVYIAGGIVPRFLEFLRQSEFRLRFEAKGRFRTFNSAIATYVVTEPQPGLIGACAYLLQVEKPTVTD
ncbi:MAG: glucokinase [Gammaproteobacteria bacterium]|nr:MAG: glucokinase [Gammaproteobacteria bacterium]